MSGGGPRLCAAETVEPSRLEPFLRQSFRPAKAELLARHGAWRHRGAGNQLVLLEGDRVIGYCGVIPVKCRLEGHTLSAVWWIDLVIDPDHRGRGLQNLFDREIRGRTQLELGFPNELAARIHRRHGWGVRQDFETLLLPLHPSLLSPLLKAERLKRLGLALAARTAAPAAALLRKRLGAFQPRWTERLDDAHPAELARLFHDSQSREIMTIERDRDYLAWRYFEGPHKEEMRFYVADGRCAAVARLVRTPRRRVVRILDLFGEMGETALLRDLIATVVRDAVLSGAAQVTIFVTLPALARASRSIGFRITGPGRFCWYSRDAHLIGTVASASQHWVLGDSDQDEPIDV